MRILAAALVALGGCGFDCDPEKLLAELAGPDATACGVLYVDDVEAIDAHNCARTAQDAHAPYWVAIDPQSADGGEISGYASDGTTTYSIRYEYVIGQLVGPDEEQVDLYTCTNLETVLPCTTLDSDLCLTCTERVRSTLKCNNI